MPNKCLAHELILEGKTNRLFLSCRVCDRFYGYVMDPESLQVIRDAIQAKGYFDPQDDHHGNYN